MFSDLRFGFRSVVFGVGARRNFVVFALFGIFLSRGGFWVVYFGGCFVSWLLYLGFLTFDDCWVWCFG